MIPDILDNSPVCLLSSTDPRLTPVSSVQVTWMLQDYLFLLQLKMVFFFDSHCVFIQIPPRALLSPVKTHSCNTKYHDSEGDKSTSVSIKAWLENFIARIGIAISTGSRSSSYCLKISWWSQSFSSIAKSLHARLLSLLYPPVCYPSRRSQWTAERKASENCALSVYYTIQIADYPKLSVISEKIVIDFRKW